MTSDHVAEHIAGPQYRRARSVLHELGLTSSFDTFVHFASLWHLHESTAIPLRYWRDLLAEWKYEPGNFLRANGRGNCVDFARGAQIALQKADIASTVVGKIPDEKFSSAQALAMRFRHTSVFTALDGIPFIFEPGWKLHQGIDVRPSTGWVNTDTWRFRTVALSSNFLEQRLVSPLGKESHRVLDLGGVGLMEVPEITRGLLRVPRRLEMLTRLGQDIPHGIISYSPETKTLASTVPGFERTSFQPEDIGPGRNRELLHYFGFDVREELGAWQRMVVGLPEDFWIR